MGSIVKTIGTSNGFIRLTNSPGGGSSTTNRIRRFTTTQANIGTAITYTDSATNGASFTINMTGVYAITFVDNRNSDGAQVGLSVNSSSINSNIAAQTEAQRLGYTVAAGADVACSFAWTGQLNAGDVVRPHGDDGAYGSASFIVSFTICQIS